MVPHCWASNITVSLNMKFCPTPTVDIKARLLKKSLGRSKKIRKD
jgi:hypothetical protein